MKRNEKHQNSRVSFAEKINKTLDISPDILPHGTMISIRGRSSMSVNGSIGILLYTPNEIKLSMHKGALSIKGSRLVCASYHTKEIRIDGSIDSISFEEE